MKGSTTFGAFTITGVQTDSCFFHLLACPVGDYQDQSGQAGCKGKLADCGKATVALTTDNAFPHNSLP
jgi:hypothetical protein